MTAGRMPLYEPINVCKPLAGGIGIVDGPLVYMSYPGLPFLRMPFPTRMTVVRLATGDVWLHSPIAYDPALARAVSAVGPVRHLVSPNKIHYAHIREWKDAFPDAITWASPGVRQRASARQVPVSFDRDLPEDAPQEWCDCLAQTVIRGRFMDEIVFFHRASRTLILTDTIQNFELDKIAQPYRFLIWMTGAYRPHGQMPLDLRSTFRSNWRQVRTAVEEMIDWKPERIVLSHGRCIDHDAIGALRFAFRWAL
jgi:hypothetical protein